MPDNTTVGNDLHPEFGIVIACCDQDLLFTKGCCASIRHFCGDLPICLIVDGNITVDSLKRAYGVTALYARDISDLRLSRESFGFGLTKMVSLWHAPFERFLFLDSDTIMWGDLPSLIGSFSDAVIDKHIGGHTDADVDEFYFRIKQFEAMFPEIDWRRHADRYFCSGVFGVRKGALDVEIYLQWLDIMRTNPGLIKPGDQTPLNLMLFAAEDDGSLKLESEKIQLITHGVPRETLSQLFPFADHVPNLAGPPIAIHWAGAKPLAKNKHVYPEPMTYFRRKFLKDAHGITGKRAGLILALEDLAHELLILKNRARRLRGKIFRRLRSA